MSHDLEDVVCVLDRRPELEDEIANSAQEIRSPAEPASGEHGEHGGWAGHASGPCELLKSAIPVRPRQRLL